MGSGLVYEWGVWSIDGEWNMYGEGEGEGEGGFVDGFEVDCGVWSGLKIWRVVWRYGDMYPGLCMHPAISSSWDWEGGIGKVGKMGGWG